MNRNATLPARYAFLLCVMGTLASCGTKSDDGSLTEETYGLTDFPETASKVFEKMDGGISLDEAEVKGRNSWILWTAGNQNFWERMARESYGIVDLLKTIDSRKRKVRFSEMGLVNEPGMEASDKPDEYGLYLDHRVGPEPADIDTRVYGKSSGVLGFRIYPNPKFDEAAKKRWDPKRYYEDADYYKDPTLIRPYRVGMTCGLCHVAPHPLYPPQDPAEPRYENLASIIGNQYLREGAVFGFDLKPGSFLWEMVHAQPPGTSDTSRIATDHINNPNAMNAIFNVDARLGEATEEKIVGPVLSVPGSKQGPVPHILKDGADSVGVPGATIRVYVNIGLFSEEWLKCHNPLVGLFPQKPFPVGLAHEKSVYWKATENRLENIKRFFLKIRPFHLEDVPEGKALLTKDADQLKRGQIAFAKNCASCHSSKQPPPDKAKDPAASEAWFIAEVQKADFRDNNFLSDDQRHSVKTIGTNSGRALATNATSGHVWDNFSSATYKELPAVGTLQGWNPATNAPYPFAAPAGGRGYYRTPSLCSLWSSAPFFHNNCLGTFTGDPSFKGRMRAFEDAAVKLLYPEKRLGPDSVWKTTQESYLEIPKDVLPEFLHLQCEYIPERKGHFLKLGPIPAGTTINLLANLDPEADKAALLKLCIRMKEVFAEIALKHLDKESAAELMKQKLVGPLLEVNKCPDFVTDKGHEYGSDLPDEDKKALIEFLKTF